MRDDRPLLLREARPAVACLLVALLYLASRPAELSPSERKVLASRFAFERHELPAARDLPHRAVRSVHPDLQRIAGWISVVGAAAALYDLDGDGLANDVCQVDPRTDELIVAPVPRSGARYAPFTLRPGPLPYDARTMAPMGALPGDFNEDGLADVLAYYWGRSPVLFLQKEGQRPGAPLTGDAFVARELIGPHQDWYTNAATQADFDGDGHLDILACNYFPEGARVLDAGATNRFAMQHSMSRASNGGRKWLFLWKGAAAGTDPRADFAAVKGSPAAQLGTGWTLAVGAHDLDGDMLPEIYLANDFGPDRLLYNRSRSGAVEFAELRGTRGLTMPRSKVVGVDSFKGMGVDFGDVNGDGWPDIFVSNIAGEFALLESHFLFLSTGEVDRMRAGTAPYSDASEPLGLSRSGWAWEARLADFDNDGVLEAMQATGFMAGRVNRWPELQELATGNDQLLEDPRSWPRFAPGDDLSGSDHNPFYVSSPDGRYHDLAADLGLAEPSISRGIAVADVDGDGRLDFVTANQWGPSYLFHNAAPAPGRFLGLRLRLPVAGPAGEGRPTASRPAIGAWAAVDLPDGRRLVGEVDGGTGHSGKRAPELHFGLGAVPSEARVGMTIRWRGTDGAVRSRSLSLKPGWHTLMLDHPDRGEVSGDEERRRHSEWGDG